MSLQAFLSVRLSGRLTSFSSYQLSLSPVSTTVTSGREVTSEEIIHEITTLLAGCLLQVSRPLSRSGFLSATDRSGSNSISKEKSREIIS